MKRLTFSIFMTLLIIVLAACGNDATSETATAETTATGGEKEVVTIGYQRGNTVNILKEHGGLDEALNKAGYVIEWKVFPTGTVMLEAINTNNVDFGHASDGNGVFMQSGGHDLNYIASESPYPEGVALVVKADSDIETVEDFKGKTIGVTMGGNQHYLLLVALEQADISLDEVDIRYYKDAAEGLSAFTTDEFDVYGTWDPYLAIVENTVETRTIINGTELTENRTFYFASEDFMAEKPELISIILEELQKSNEWANESKDEVSEIVASELGLDVEPIQQANDRRTFGVQKINDEIVASQQQLADTFYEAGLLESKIRIEDAINIDEAWIPSNVE